MRFLPSAALALLAASSATVQPETSGDMAGTFKDVRGSSAEGIAGTAAPPPHRSSQAGPRLKI
jgi:hypothetical protein